LLLAPDTGGGSDGKPNSSTGLKTGGENQGALPFYRVDSDSISPSRQRFVLKKSLTRHGRGPFIRKCERRAPSPREAMAITVMPTGLCNSRHHGRRLQQFHQLSDPPMPRWQGVLRRGAKMAPGGGRSMFAVEAVLSFQEKAELYRRQLSAPGHESLSGAPGCKGKPFGFLQTENFVLDGCDDG
jgi:hypothetical protein